MALGMNRWSWWQKSLGSKSMRREALLNLLRHRYVRERQHAMRYRQHAERMSYPQFRDVLLSIAAEEELHAQWVGAKIVDLGEKSFQR
jgi:rubrerythrin